MPAKQSFAEKGKLDTKEFELPETIFVRDIENRVFQGIVLKCLSSIDGVSPVVGNFIDNILGRDSLEGIRGIHIQQDSKHQCVSIKVEVNVGFGVSIPEKADEIQTMITKEITELTGLHVSEIHVLFKNIVHNDQLKKIVKLPDSPHAPVLIETDSDQALKDEC